MLNIDQALALTEPEAIVEEIIFRKTVHSRMGGTHLPDAILKREQQDWS